MLKNLGRQRQSYTTANADSPANAGQQSQQNPTQALAQAKVRRYSFPFQLSLFTNLM
jgi:hypothetical protein